MYSFMLAHQGMLSRIIIFFYKVFSNSTVYSLQVFLVNIGGRPTKTTCESANDNAYFPHCGKQMLRTVKNVFRFASISYCSVRVNLNCSVFIPSSFKSIFIIHLKCDLS